MVLIRGARAAGPRVGELSEDGQTVAPSMEMASLLYFGE